ncbi:MAG: FKBP-type peptidyl-prolyl cis-trans isomerase [Myxococcota bacterium]|nr:FKBP-type peptidyl-prolyl cis-trans isomerase [Myxococcota bacterium]
MTRGRKRGARAALLGIGLLLTAVGSPAPAQEPAAADPAKPRRFVRVKAPNGIVIRRYNKTDGEMPEKESRVVIHYHGTLLDGTVFDSSVERRRPASFPLEKVIPCWQEALPLLRVGEKAQLRCPPSMAYGLKGSPPKIPPNSTLIFEVEILSVQ